MKKIVLTMVAACAALTMNAQMYVGGSLNFNANTETTEATAAGVTVSSDDKTTSFGIAPEVGFKLADNMAVGVAVGFNMSNNEPSSTKTVKGTDFSIAPYFRYTALTWGNLSLFADAQVTVSTGKETTELTTTTGKVSSDDKTSGFSVAVVPGISYQLNDQINFVAKLGRGLGYFQTKEEPAAGPTVTDKNFGLDLNTLGLSFGMYYNF